MNRLEAGNAALSPGDNSFYMQTDIPWTRVSIDGQQIKLPRTSIDAPVTLKPGSHLITWRAAPFQPQSCHLSIPYTPGDTCDFAQDEVSQPGSDVTVLVVLLHESLATLPPLQQAGLLKALRANLSSIQASDTVQPGEMYLKDSVNMIATRPLQATLRISLDTSSDSVCALDATSMEPYNCKLAGQNCWQLCALNRQMQPAQQDNAGKRWLAFVPIHLSWNYTALDGQTIASNQPIDESGVNYAPATDELLLFSIAWQAGHWQVRSLLGPKEGAPAILDSGQLNWLPGVNIPIADDPACVAAQNVFAELPNYQVQFLSGSNPAAGCLVAVPGDPNHSSSGSASSTWQAALFLERFGVTLAANAAAHALQPHWPLANAYERARAQQLLLG